MTTYNTGNTLGSTDPRDLYDNAENLDTLTNGAQLTYPDRLGVSRRTLAGIDAAADLVLGGLGYAPPVAYTAGISLTLTTQTVEYSGEVYAPKSSSLPFTTSGVFESSSFRLIQGVSSAELSSSGGSGLVGFDLSETYPAGTVGSQLQDIYGPIGQVVTCYGDSFTMGLSGGITYPQAYISLIAAEKNWSIPVPPDFGTPGKGSTSVGNQAFGGSQIASTEQIDRIMAHTTTDTDIQFILTGINDIRAYGFSSGGVSTYRQTLQAALAWMALPASNGKIFANESNPAIALRLGTGWTANASWFNGQGYHTPVQGDSFNTTVFGDTVYIALPRDTSTTGKCSIYIDGENYGEYDYSGSVAAVQYGKAYSMGFVRIAGLRRTFHGVILTKTSANTGADYMRVDWVAGVDGIQNAQGTEGGPQVYVGNCCRLTTAGYAMDGPSYNNGNDSVVHGYNIMIEQCVRELAADGLNITYVDAGKYFNPNSSDLAADGIHPSATGMQKIANAFLERMDTKRVHPNDRGTLAGLQEFIGRRFTSSSLGSVTELGDLKNTSNFAGSGAQTSMSHNVKIVDGFYYRINDLAPAWMFVLNPSSGPVFQTVAAGTGKIASWDRVLGLTSEGQPTWIAPTFQNSWVDQGVWAPTGYRKDSFGLVHLRGLVINGTIALPSFTLPVGYRPVGKQGFPIVSNGLFGWVSITEAGLVTVEAGSNAWASLSGITFQAA